MTIDEQLRAIARHAEEQQRPITVEEIVARASGHDGPQVPDPPRPSTAWRHRRHWLLAAAAVVVVAAVVGLLAVDADDGSDSIRTVTDPPTTPAGPIRNGSIAFAADAGGGSALTDPVDFQRVETVPEPMDIYITRAGEPIRRLVSSGAHERCPAFSPDGERLAYLSVLSGPPPGSYPETGPPLEATLVVRRLDEAAEPSDPELLVDFPAATGYGVRRDVGYPCPQWSPDGSRLAYLAHPVGSTDAHADVAELRVATLDGQEQVVNAGRAADARSTFAWSPTGDAIAYVRDDGVWAASMDGRAPSRVWETDRMLTGVSWSARGELAVTVEAQDPRAGLEVHIVDADAATLVDTLQDAGSVSWSPDGSRLAFVRGDGQLVLSDRDDGSTVSPPAPVVEGREVGLADVSWSPDGERLLSLVWSVHPRVWDEDPGAFLESPGMALLSLSTDGALVEVLTPWTWALDWISLRDVSWGVTE